MTDAARKSAAPHSLEAEQAILGGLMLDPQAWVDVDGIITATDFFDQRHALIFDAVERLSADRQPTDPVTVAEKLKREAPDGWGGLRYLGELTRDTPGAANVGAYAGIVKDHALRRRMIEQGRRMAALATIGFEREELDALQTQILDLTTERARGGLEAAWRLLPDYGDEISRRAEAKSHLVGPSSGFEGIDRLTLGLKPGSLMVIGARPSMGKTALLSAIAARCTMHPRHDAGAFFSLEMPKRDILNRIFAREMPAHLEALRTGNLSESMWDSFTRVSKLLYERNLYIDDTSSLTIGEMRARARRQHHRCKLRWIGVDYLQLVSAPGKDENSQLTVVSKGLKALAKELECCVIALAQLNREVEKRESKRPTLADLRGSGSLEQDADVVAFLWADQKDRPWRNFSVDKNRNGPLGDAQLSWDAKHVRFDDPGGQEQIDWGMQLDSERKPKKSRARSPEDSGADRRSGNDD